VLVAAVTAALRPTVVPTVPTVAPMAVTSQKAAIAKPATARAMNLRSVDVSFVISSPASSFGLRRLAEKPEEASADAVNGLVGFGRRLF
jgi:hypothetical protein